MILESGLAIVCTKAEDCTEVFAVVGVNGNEWLPVSKEDLSDLLDEDEDENLEYVEIPERLFPAGPLTFTVGMMANAADPTKATAYMDWITSAQGQEYFEAAGFIPAVSPKGMELVEKLGVKDVA